MEKKYLVHIRKDNIYFNNLSVFKPGKYVKEHNSHEFCLL